MTRVKFSSPQPSVKYYTSKDLYYIFICLNEEEMDEINENDEVIHSYVYDYEEVITPINDIDIKDVQINPDRYLNYDLLLYKNEKISISKQLLKEYLITHPITSSCHGGKEAEYSITEEKQNLMVRALLMYQSKLESGIQAELKWNSTGNECEVWTLDEFKQLMLEMDAVVNPLVSLQQKYETDVMACTSKDEVDAIFINYE